MREILFRGKTEKGEWVEGYYEFGYDAGTEEPTHYMWVLNHTEKYGEMFIVIPETVGQDTGRIDRNFKRIFEGDIVTGLFIFGLSVNAVVTFQDGAFGLEWRRGNINTFNAFTSICNVEYEVIGNIHDNPELSKERR